MFRNIRVARGKAVGLCSLLGHCGSHGGLISRPGTDRGDADSAIAASRSSVTSRSDCFVSTQGVVSPSLEFSVPAELAET